MTQKPWQNHEGYADPTAFNALKNICKEESDQQKRVSDLVSVLKYVIDAAGFDLMNRIELRDRSTGKIYK
jgi:hypothetical protein